MLNRFAKLGCIFFIGSAGICDAAWHRAAAQQFSQGPCSGVLCSTIGGQSAPQPQKSLFPEGQCGGVLCSAIGGSQAPQHAEPPPSCGGGLFCDMNPYGMGVPVTAAEAQRLQSEHARDQAVAPLTPAPARRQARKAHRKVAAAKSAANSPEASAPR